MARALLVAAGTSALLVFARVLEGVSWPGLRCLFREASGLPCPFCGGTHALAALAHGHPAEAFSANPLVCTAAVAGVAAPLIMLAARMLATRAPGTRATTRVVLALLAAQWIYLAARGARP